MKTVRVDVTQQDIDDACAAIKAGGLVSENCPVNRALTRATGTVFRIRVPYVAEPVDPKLPVVILPSEAQLWIRDFDANDAVRPMRFDMSVPEVCVNKKVPHA